MILVWKVTGHRNNPDGGTSDVLSTVFGPDETFARRNFNFIQTKAQASEAAAGDTPRPTWQPHELTFTQVQQK